MKIRAESKNGVLRLMLAGELDHHAATGAMREIDSILDRMLPVDCAIDLSALSFMDSSGIAIILKVYRRMQLCGGRTVIINPAPQPLRVLDASGVGNLVRIVTTVKERVHEI